MARLRHIFFDLDHTLWDFETNSTETLKWLYNHYQLQELGIPDVMAFIAVYKQNNNKLWDNYRSGLIDKESLRIKRFAYVFSQYGIMDHSLIGQFSEHYMDACPLQKNLLPGTESVLQFLSVNYQIHIITNGFEMTQYRKLRNSGIISYFTHIITSENAGCLKPNPRIFAHALEKANAQATEVVYIGDSYEVDVRGAQNAGWTAIHFSSVKKEGDHHTIHHLEELLSWLKKS